MPRCCIRTCVTLFLTTFLFFLGKETVHHIYLMLLARQHVISTFNCVSVFFFFLLFFLNICYSLSVLSLRMFFVFFFPTRPISVWSNSAVLGSFARGKLKTRGTRTGGKKNKNKTRDTRTGTRDERYKRRESQEQETRTKDKNMTHHHGVLQNTSP